MADNSFLIRKSATLSPQASVPTNPVNGDIYYDSVANTFIFYDNGEWINLASRADVPSAAILTSANFTPLVVQNSFVRITGSTVSNIYGLAASTDGKQVIVYNQSTVNAVIKQQSSTETNPANRIITMSGMDVTFAAGMMAMFVYDASQARWICDPFEAGQNAVNTYPSLYVTDEVDLTNAIAAAIIDGGGVICLLNAFTISSSHTIPPDTVLIGRKGDSIVTVLSGGSITLGNYSTAKDVYMTTALSSGTLMTLSNIRSVVDGCKFTVPGSSTAICINVTGSFNIIKACTFAGVLAPDTGVGIDYSGGTDNVDIDSLFET
jgi:hypothetical protein